MMRWPKCVCDALKCKIARWGLSALFTGYTVKTNRLVIRGVYRAVNV